MTVNSVLAQVAVDQSLARHNFFYADQSKQRRMFIVKDGGHLINNWYNEWNKEPMDTANAPVQAIEVIKDGRLVWQLKAWRNPDLGPSITIQLLTEAVNRGRLFFGEFNAQAPKLFVGPNEPIGVGRGIHPGRVAWIHSPGVARWDGKIGLWIEDRWNDQAKCIVDADYLINSALLKTHNGPGVTLTSKNWYGATDINLLWRQNAHNNVSQDKRHGKPELLRRVSARGRQHTQYAQRHGLQAGRESTHRATRPDGALRQGAPLHKDRPEIH